MNSNITLGSFRKITETGLHCTIFSGSQIIFTGFLFEASTEYDNYTIVKLDFDVGGVDICIVNGEKNGY